MMIAHMPVPTAAAPSHPLTALRPLSMGLLPYAWFAGTVLDALCPLSPWASFAGFGWTVGVFLLLFSHRFRPPRCALGLFGRFDAFNHVISMGGTSICIVVSIASRSNNRILCVLITPCMAAYLANNHKFCRKSRLDLFWYIQIIHLQNKNAPRRMRLVYVGRDLHPTLLTGS